MLLIEIVAFQNFMTGNNNAQLFDYDCINNIVEMSKYSLLDHESVFLFSQLGLTSLPRPLLKSFAR